MDRPEGPSSNLFLDQVLIQVMFCLAILFIIRIFRVCIESLLYFSVVGGITMVVPERTLVAGVCT